MKVEFRKSFTKDLKNVSDKSLLQRVKSEIEIIEKANFLQEIANRKKLKGFENFFRLKVADYRLGFALKMIRSFLSDFYTKDIYKFFP